MARSTTEWQGKSDDTQPPPRVIIRLMEKQRNRCAECGRMLRPKHFACDHIQALVNGGKNAESNLQLLCNSPCHAAKTRADVAEKSRTYRKKAAHLGVKAKGRGFRTGKDSPFKQKIGGGVVYRDTGEPVGRGRR